MKDGFIILSSILEKRCISFVKKPFYASYLVICLTLLLIIIYSSYNQSNEQITYITGFSRSLISQNLGEVRFYEDGKYMFYDSPTDKSGFSNVIEQKFYAWNNLNSDMIIDVYITSNDHDYYLWAKLYGDNVTCILPRNNPYRLRVNGTVYYNGESNVYVTQIWTTTVRKNWRPLWSLE